MWRDYAVAIRSPRAASRSRPSGRLRRPWPPGLSSRTRSRIWQRSLGSGWRVESCTRPRSGLTAGRGYTRSLPGSRPACCASRSATRARSCGRWRATRATRCTPRSRGMTTPAHSASSWRVDGLSRSLRRTLRCWHARARPLTGSSTTCARSRRRWRRGTRTMRCPSIGGGSHLHAALRVDASGALNGRPSLDPPMSSAGGAGPTGRTPSSDRLEIR